MATQILQDENVLSEQREQLAQTLRAILDADERPLIRIIRAPIPRERVCSRSAGSSPTSTSKTGSSRPSRPGVT